MKETVSGGFFLNTM